MKWDAWIQCFESKLYRLPTAHPEITWRRREVSLAASSPPVRRCRRVLNVVTKGAILTWIQMVSSIRIHRSYLPGTGLPTKPLDFSFLHATIFVLNHQQQNEENEAKLPAFQLNPPT